MSDRNLLKSSLPIGAVAATIVILGGGIVWLTTIASRAEATAASVEEVQGALKDYPTRHEFQTLQEGVTRIETSVNKINDYLLKK